MITREDREQMLKDIRVRLPHNEIKGRESLLKDLCGRLPYGVIGLIHNANGSDYKAYIVGGDIDLFSHNFINIKPYLRPLSSMTEEEYDDMFHQLYSAQEEFFRNCSNTDTIEKLIANDMVRYDWLDKNMFDYRGLIERGLAIEAPEGMYNITK